jgi:hypothetical protein
MRTVAGPSSAVQWVFSGGRYTVASHVRQVQVAATAVTETGDMPDEDLVGAKWMPARTPCWRAGDPLAVGRPHQIAQHAASLEPVDLVGQASCWRLNSSNSAGSTGQRARALPPRGLPGAGSNVAVAVEFGSGRDGGSTVAESAGGA